MLYQRVADERELLDGLASPGAVILCGGTDLMVKMRSGAIRPDVLLDISRVTSMRGIRIHGSNLEIGAATLESDILQSPLVGHHFPLLGSVLKQLGSVQIRNRGTLGGNIVNASPAADSAIPLLLYDAEIQLVSSKSERWIRVADFFIGPGRTALESGAFVRTLRLPISDDRFGSFFHKVGKRNALTIAIASLGALMRVGEGVIQELRVAVGSVAPTPRRLQQLETQLTGRRLDASLIEEARQSAADSVSPISDVRASASYRKNVIGDLLARALQPHLR